jgi:ethanolamine utilization protein EutA
MGHEGGPPRRDHSGGDYHDHDAEGYGVPESEKIELTSTGIDIGSSTSHLMLSQIEMRRNGTALSSGFRVVRRQIVYRSPVLLTPYASADTIDVERLGEFIARAYREAGMSPECIHTGAVIITGEAARKENAARIIQLFARHSGKFVCATAGPILEARLAAHGSGAVDLSRDRGERPVLNVDFGGGTTKISLMRNGDIEGIMVVNVGARLVAWDAQDRLTRIEQAGFHAAAGCGLSFALGDQIGARAKRALAEWLIHRLFEYLQGRDLSEPAQRLLVSGDVFRPPADSVVVFSGGVSEYVYGQEQFDYGDMGLLMGELVKARLSSDARGFSLTRGLHQLRATVIGASQYTVQVSGNTIFLPAPDLLPIYNLPAIHVKIANAEPTREEVARAIERSLDGFGLEHVPHAVALAFHTRMVVTYRHLRAFAEGIVEAKRARGLEQLVILLEQDFAGLLGNILQRDFKIEQVVCLDQVQTGDLDFVDIGQMIDTAKAVPVIVKSLVFC